MKTSLNVPEWLRREAEAASPDIPFGTLLRDALVIALPEWRKHSTSSREARLMRYAAREERTHRQVTARDLGVPVAELRRLTPPRAAGGSRAARTPTAVRRRARRS